jgi:N-acetylglucosaminyl-diphospho-decaprenol L-rhamnosyltransferase
MEAAVDVVVPTRDTRDITLRCVSSIVASSDVLARCIVVDNMSRDHTVEAITERWPSVTVIRSARNLGFGTACNIGTRCGNAEFILILNSDVMARSGAIASLIHFLRSHPEHVVASGRLVYAGTDQPQVGFAMRRFPSLASQVALMLGLERYWPRNPVSRRALMLDFDFSCTQDVDAQPAGACLLCRRSAFEKVGGFDGQFFYWFEDVDLIRRMSRLGRIAYVHDAVFDHLGGATFGQWHRADVIASRYQGLLRYFAKHQPRHEVFTLRLVTALLAAIRAAPLLALDGRRARAYAAVARRALTGE